MHHSIASFWNIQEAEKIIWFPLEEFWSVKWTHRTSFQRAAEKLSQSWGDSWDQGGTQGRWLRRAGAWQGDAQTARFCRSGVQIYGFGKMQRMNTEMPEAAWPRICSRAPNPDGTTSQGQSWNSTEVCQTVKHMIHHVKWPKEPVHVCLCLTPPVLQSDWPTLLLKSHQRRHPHFCLTIFLRS